MSGLELLLAAASLAWFASLLGLSVKLVRARRPEEHEEAYHMMAAVVVAGVVMFVAPEGIKWLTHFDNYTWTEQGEEVERYCSENPNNLEPNMTKDEVCLPEGMSSIFNKLIFGLRALGGVILVVGLIWSGIKLLAVPGREPSRSSERSARAVKVL